KKLYIEAECNFTDGHTSSASIQDMHDNIVFVKSDGNTIYNSAESQTEDSDTSRADNHGEDDYDLTLSSIYEYACNVSLADIEWLKEAVILNDALSKEGLNHDYGLKVGKTILSQSHDDIFGNGLIRRCMAKTAAASDARMAGCTLAAMSNSGSGNQGITVTMPVVAVAEEIGSTDEQLIRALVLSHLVAIHIKHYLGRLSALCGCVIASTGAACGIVMLRGGGFVQICYAIKNMIGNITGMVCDGAKEGCALKVASGVSSALQSAVMALDNLCISEHDGIIEKDTEKTIRNLGEIGSKGMAHTDEMILDIMVCK
ncbi:MAG: serine dehydratase subunit alpha family protein, partial [Bacteroidales bacterium]|nr:serine dehydratase subunit alpha family protein [Bacteroidales bacterium]